MIQYGCLDSIGKDVAIRTFKGQLSLPSKSERTDHSRWIAGPGLQNVRLKVDEVPDPRQICECVCVFFKGDKQH
jgi:hypothetical protein